MRLDKWIKVSRIIKRRTVAKEVADSGRIKVNGIVAKPSRDLKEGDIIEIEYAKKILKVKVLVLAEHVKKEEGSKMYEVLSGSDTL